jgi:hypothetical protein
MKKTIFAALLLCNVTGFAAEANEAEAMACAESPHPEAGLVFDKVTERPWEAAPRKTTMATRGREFVLTDRLTREAARAAAEAASECWGIARNCTGEIC